MTLRQRLTLIKLSYRLHLRHTFMHGHVRTGLTFMAVYAAGAEFLHDFFHHHETVHWLLSLFGTNHAVGFIALSHLSEHYKEHLENQERPPDHLERHKRHDIMRVFDTSKSADAFPQPISGMNQQWHNVGGVSFPAFLASAKQASGRPDVTPPSSAEEASK